MPKPEWGVKRQCANCGARFYDLNADPATCPECGAVFEIEALIRGKRARPALRGAVVESEADIVIETDDDADDDTVIETDDDDDAAEVPVPVAAPGDEDADEDIEAEDAVLLDDDVDEDDDLGDFGDDETDEDRR